MRLRDGFAGGSAKGRSDLLGTIAPSRRGLPASRFKIHLLAHLFNRDDMARCSSYYASATLASQLMASTLALAPVIVEEICISLRRFGSSICNPRPSEPSAQCYWQPRDHAHLSSVTHLRLIAPYRVAPCIGHLNPCFRLGSRDVSRHQSLCFQAMHRNLT
jgi:hypothetical protein